MMSDSYEVFGVDYSKDESEIDSFTNIAIADPVSKLKRQDHTILEEEKESDDSYLIDSDEEGSLKDGSGPGSRRAIN